jgi:hypothetical protein
MSKVRHKLLEKANSFQESLSIAGSVCLLLFSSNSAADLFTHGASLTSPLTN